MMFTRRQEMKMTLNYTKNSRMMKRIILLMILGIMASTSSYAQPKPIDKIVAVLGESIILTSDIDGQYSQYLAQG